MGAHRHGGCAGAALAGVPQPRGARSLPSKSLLSTCGDEIALAHVDKTLRPVAATNLMRGAACPEFEQSCCVTQVRAHAVVVLARADDEELCQYLLQLVQARVPRHLHVDAEQAEYKTAGSPPCCQ